MDDAFAHYSEKARGRRQRADMPALTIDLASWQEADIPRRDWIARSYLLRGSLTLLSGAAGASKSSLLVAWSIALALGQTFHRFSPARAMRVALYNVEDDGNEQRRRFSAALRQFRAQSSDIDGRISRITPVGVGTLIEFNSDAGPIQETPAMLALRTHVEEFKPDVLILDPFAELHSAPENDNIALRAVMAHLRTFAADAGIAILVVHHSRKGPQIAGDQDAARGASSIVGAARIALTVTGMQEEEARAFSLKPDDRRHFFRVDGAKSNYSALSEAEWFQRFTVELENGDDVAAPEPWHPPVDVVTPEMRLAIEADIAAGSPDGPWSPKLSQDDRSIRTLMLRNGVSTAEGQKKLMKELLAGGYAVRNFRHPERRHVAQGIQAPDGRPNAVTWSEEGKG